MFSHSASDFLDYMGFTKNPNEQSVLHRQLQVSVEK